ncbi:sensor histidine kinase [Microlunatus parietis]|uniref:Signal transduction histidine kinase n=1 Tax=Microlunatus parietis TaxID=682979 RepID=A0A7Y9I5D9_9ACTN|nr:GAF domain-containing protein [Microlunatus parietis]NYE70418.1 signal transduction histidine kinase [Microlunatus parietis]
MDRRHVLPTLPLDQLLNELQSRLTAVLAARDGVHALLDAVVTIGAELDLETVLQRIVEAARTLADCRYAALGVIGEEGELAEFLPTGMTDDEVAGIPELPHGRGLLGLLIKNPQVLRVADLSSHPESYGFPPGHPPMRRFLGVPILIRDECFGNLYLTEKSGGLEFDEQDETIVQALASVAGIAIKNARLYQETKAREVWLDAIAEVTRILLSGADRRQAFGTVVARAREMTGAAAAWIIQAEDDRLRVDVADGMPGLAGREFSAEGSVSSQVLLTQEPVLLTDLEQVAVTFDVELPGPTLLLPLGPTSQGILAVARRTGGVPFSADSMRMLGSFGQQVGVVMELADARREAERYGLIDDRERIGRDLHDVVIQRLYGVAIQLVSAGRLTAKPQVAERIQSAVDNLDDTIRQIRSTIFALQANDGVVATRPRVRITRLVDQAGAQLGFQPAVRTSGLLDTNLPDPVADDLCAVLTEALSNVGRHANATQADVAIDLSDDGLLEVRVVDNGVGLGDAERRSGLANLERRAARRGGFFEVGPSDDGGTLVVWRVPVR